MRNVVERLLLLASQEGVTSKDVDSILASGGPAPRFSAASGTLSERVAIYERETILRELDRNDHHITRTAKSLGLERSYFYRKCQQLGVDLHARRGGN